MKSPLERLYATKLALLATISTVVGVALLVLVRWAENRSEWAWLKNLPIADVGSALFTSGLIVIFFEYLDQQDEEARETERLRRVLADVAPDIRDAVVDGFAFAPDSLVGVASSATLDRVIQNTLGIQLDDKELAVDVYADLRERVIEATQRWYDAQVSVDLAPWDGGPTSGEGSMFVATVRWEYRVQPTNPIIRFTCVSDLDEYRELLHDPSLTGAWYFQSRAGMDGASPDAFQLLQFDTDGKPQHARRSSRRGAQTFTVDIGSDVVTEHRMVTVAFTYRILVQRHGHLLHLDFSYPVKGLTVHLRYGGCAIRYVNTLDYVSGARQPRITALPASDV